MIAVIDYRAGNLTSVVKALRYLGAAEIEVTQDPEMVRDAAKVVLPGVGHFQATRLLDERGLTEAVRESVDRGTWFLGVCVGLQWLYAGSTEAPGVSGLGHFAGECERFSCQVSRRGAEGAACGVELARADPGGLAADAGRAGGGVRLLHALLAGAGERGYRGRDALRRSVYGGGGAG